MEAILFSKISIFVPMSIANSGNHFLRDQIGNVLQFRSASSSRIALATNILNVALDTQLVSKGIIIAISSALAEFKS